MPDTQAEGGDAHMTNNEAKGYAVLFVLAILSGGVAMLWWSDGRWYRVAGAAFVIWNGACGASALRKWR